MKILTLVCLILFITGCSNVHYFKQAKNVVKGDSVSIYIDALGNIYPEAGLDESFDPPSKLQDGLYDLMVSKESDLCSLNVANNTDAKRLCDSVYSKGCSELAIRSGRCPMTSEWRSVQSQIWKERAQKIYKLSTSGEKSKTIVFLIHGFNTGFYKGSSSYETAKLKIRDVVENPLFVQVYWDGQEAAMLIDPILFWTQAQAAGPLVGFELRQLLNELTDIHESGPQSEESMPPIRVLTHSSGAFVAGSMFGNPVKAFPLLQDPVQTNKKGEILGSWDRFRELGAALKGGNRIPQVPDLRVGMLAPATGDFTFTEMDVGSERRGWAVESSVALSINSYDSMLTKFGTSSDLFGATGAGAEIWRYCDLIKPALEKKGYQSKAFNFDNDMFFIYEHGFHNYLNHPSFEDFMKNLFVEEPFSYPSELGCS